MRKAVFGVLLALVAAATFAVVTAEQPDVIELQPALAGPEPPSSPDNFRIVFQEKGNPPLTYDQLFFSPPWDFEDRDGYECANIAIFDPTTGERLLQVDFEQSKDYRTGVTNGTEFIINDRFGVEPEQGSGPQTPCGNEQHGPPSENPDQSRWDPSGEDHFPHVHAGASEQTHGVTIRATDPADTELVELLAAAEDQFVDAITNSSCDRAYFTPGDEKREGVIWWDEDFPENGHHDGSDPLNCGGGGGEPLAVARFYFAVVAEGIEVCILDHEREGGAWCTGEAPPPSPTETPSPTQTESPSPTQTESPPPDLVCEVHVFFEGTPLEATHTACHA